MQSTDLKILKRIANNKQVPESSALSRLVERGFVSRKKSEKRVSPSLPDGVPKYVLKFKYLRKRWGIPNDDVVFDYGYAITSKGKRFLKSINSNKTSQEQEQNKQIPMEDDLEDDDELEYRF